MIDNEYIGRVLRLPEKQIVDAIETTEVVESNTALVMKINVQIGGDDAYAKRLFVKTIKGNQSENVYHSKNMREGEFYQIVKDNKINYIPVPVCYDAFISEEEKKFLIVLDDISGEYITPSNASIHEHKTWFSCAESLAKLHAAFWNHKIIDAMRGEYIEEVQSGDSPYIKKVKERVPLFISEFDNQFDAKTKETLEKAAEINIMSVNETARRIIDNNNVTICNGDSHIHNFMLPVSDSDMPLIVDFQFWGEGIGTGDLAHLTRVKFSDELKREIQLSVVEHYYKTLLANGVVGYSWDNCLRDYHMSVASMVLIPMWQYTGFKIAHDEWKDDLQGLIYNFDYLKCGELLL